jgi:predicted transcriptional regulator
LPHTIAKKLREEGRTWKEIAALLEVSLSSIYMNGTHKNEN